MASANLLGKKRAHEDAFTSDTAGNQTDSPRKRRVKIGNGNQKYTVATQRLFVKNKKATYEDCFSDKPPNENYSYLPVGFRKIKEWCRDECLRTGKLYYVVSLFPTQIRPSKTATNMITKNIYRHGWHFPKDMVLSAFRANGIGTQETLAQARNPILSMPDPPKQLVTTKNISDLFKDLFPGMPETDILQCIGHAFKEGSGRVGESGELQFARRVQLAVLAHIRHVYTDYDSRLRSKKQHRNLARLNIERQCVSKLLKWRGEDDEFELEEREAEVLIIDDSDEESDNDLTKFDSSSSDSDVEIMGFYDSETKRAHFISKLPDVFNSPKYAGLFPKAHDPTQAIEARRPQTALFGYPLLSRAPSIPSWGAPPARAQSHHAQSQHRASVVPGFLSGGYTVPQSPFAVPTTVLPETPIFGNPSIPRPVTILADSPASVPKIVYDKVGDAFSFDLYTHTVTQLPRPPLSAVRSVIRSVEMEPKLEPPYHNAKLSELRMHDAFGVNPEPLSTTVQGGDGRTYRMAPASTPMPQVPHFGEPSFTSGFNFTFNRGPYPAPHSSYTSSTQHQRQRFSVVPPNAQYVDLTIDDSLAGPGAHPGRWQPLAPYQPR